MLVDTDVLVWILRGNPKAARAIDRLERRRVSVVTYMELLQGARDKTEARQIKSFVADLGFEMLPLTQAIGHRAAVYMEEYGSRVALCMGDALIAATATEHAAPLLTGNAKHYKLVSGLELARFKP
jgi:predicted nucleic acid-binding protein